MITDCTAVVLAGGSSKRMGRDKANLLLHGKTLLQHIVETMQQNFPEVIVSVRQPRPESDMPQVNDVPQHAGPLAGLAAGLERASHPWLFVTACDMPFMTPAVIECLASRRADFQAVVPVVSGHPQPMAAFYAASCLAEAQSCLMGGGNHSLRALLDRLSVRYVSEREMLVADPQLCSFFDLDTPQDVDRAMKSMLRARCT